MVKSTGFQFLFTNGKEKKRLNLKIKRDLRHINQMPFSDTDLV